MRIVIKIGTSTLAHPTGHLNIRRVEQLCKIMSDIKNAGHELILVSSGAIGMGVGKLGLRERPKDIPSKQAAAAVGQCELMYTYDKLFSEYHHTVAQLLITGDDTTNDTRRFNFTNTLNRLLELGALSQHLQHGDGGCPAAGHIVMLLPPIREKGDVGEQVDRGLEDIERVIAAKIVKAVLRVAALNVAAIALSHGIQPALMPVTGNAVFIESDEHGVVIFLCPVLGFFTAFVDEFLARESIEYLAVDAPFL